MSMLTGCSLPSASLSTLVTIPVRRVASLGSKQNSVPSMRKMVISSRRRSSAPAVVSFMLPSCMLSFSLIKIFTRRDVLVDKRPPPRSFSQLYPARTWRKAEEMWTALPYYELNRRLKKLPFFSAASVGSFVGVGGVDAIDVDEVAAAGSGDGAGLLATSAAGDPVSPVVCT